MLYPPSDWVVVNAHRRGFIFQSEKGTFVEPFLSVQDGLDEVPRDGTVWITPGHYNFRGTITQRVTLRCPYTYHHPAIESPNAAVLGMP